MARTSATRLRDLRAGLLPADTCQAICSGVLALPARERAELLCVIASENPHSLAVSAEAALAAIAPQDLLPALECEDAAPELIAWCATHLGQRPEIAESLALHHGCPGDLLAPLIPQVSPAAIRQLLDALERLAASPLLIEALWEVPLLTEEERSLLEELRRGAMQPEEPPFAAAALEDSPTVAAAPSAPSLSERLLHLSVLGRIRLAMSGSREERMSLVRDSNKVVQRAVLQSPRITPQEIESIAAMTNLAGETLRWLGTNRKLVKQYAVVRNLVNNPKTPLDTALPFIPRLNQADLKMLTRNKNIADTLRSAAARLFAQRSARH